MTGAVILDTDMVSAFAKIKRLDLLIRIFSKNRILITPRIYEELAISLDFGYVFPLEIFSRFPVEHPSEKESENYRRMLIEERRLGKGELEAISICKIRGYMFSSLDSLALSVAKKNGIKTLNLHSILRALWESGIQSKDEVRGIIEEIEEKDNTQIKDIDSIFQ